MSPVVARHVSPRRSETHHRVVWIPRGRAFLFASDSRSWQRSIALAEALTIPALSADCKGFPISSSGGPAVQPAPGSKDAKPKLKFRASCREDARCALLEVLTGPFGFAQGKLRPPSLPNGKPETCVRFRYPTPAPYPGAGAGPCWRARRDSNPQPSDPKARIIQSARVAGNRGRRSDKWSSDRRTRAATGDKGGGASIWKSFVFVNWWVWWVPFRKTTRRCAMTDEIKLPSKLRSKFARKLDASKARRAPRYMLASFSPHP